jgi:leucyl-tRNA synthetase
MAKGRQSDFDPKKPKKLTVFTTADFPAWQAKYIALLKEVWDPAANAQRVDDKELNGRIGKMGEMKKAMPFVQALKKRLRDGEPAEAVLERKLAFDEGKTLLVCRLTHPTPYLSSPTLPSRSCILMRACVCARQWSPA